MTTNTEVLYKNLEPNKRLHAWVSLRDLVATLVSEKKKVLAKYQAEDFGGHSKSDREIADETNLAKNELEQVKKLQESLDNDEFILAYLKGNNVALDAEGNAIKLLKEVEESEELNFDMYEGSFFRRYSAESRHFNYKIIKRYDSRKYTAIAEAKNGNEDEKVLESHSSVSLAIDYLKRHHRNQIS